MSDPHSILFETTFLKALLNGELTVIVFSLGSFETSSSFWPTAPSHNLVPQIQTECCLGLLGSRYSINCKVVLPPRKASCSPLVTTRLMCIPTYFTSFCFTKVGSQPHWLALTLLFMEKFVEALSNAPVSLKYSL